LADGQKFGFKVTAINPYLGIISVFSSLEGQDSKGAEISHYGNLNTLMIDDDNRHQHQSEVTNILADLV